MSIIISKVQRGSMLLRTAAKRSASEGGMDWKYKINDVMGKYEPKYKGGRMREAFSEVCKGLDVDV